jgi:hypothetical protein
VLNAVGVQPLILLLQVGACFFSVVLLFFTVCA